MADPTKYSRDYGFANYQANRPDRPLPGTEVDVELDNIAASIGETVDALKDIRRADGALKNGIVTRDSLADDISVDVGAAADRAEAAAAQAEAFGTVYTQTDAQMASVTIDPGVTTIWRLPSAASAGQVAPVGLVSQWRRNTAPGAGAYFTSAGGAVWTRTGYEEERVLSTLQTTIAALGTEGQRIYATRAAAVAALTAGVPATVTRVGWYTNVLGSAHVSCVFVTRQTDATAISDLPGWVPDGDWRPEHFGAVAGNSAAAAANLTAIHAAIAALPINGTLTFGDGIYYTSGTVEVKRRIGLHGTGYGRCWIQCTSITQSVMRFAPPDSSTQFLDAPSLDGIGLVGGNGGTGATAGYALEIIRCNNGKFKSFRFSGSANGILLEGGQDVRISDFHGWGRFGGTMIAGSSLFEARTATWDGGVQKNYQCEVMDFRLSGHTSKVIEDIIKIHSADGLQFTGGYVNFGARSLVRWELDDTNQGAGPVTFTSVYFDGVRNDSTGSDHFMSGATTAGASLTATFNGCHIGNFGQSIFDCPTDFGVSALTFSACRFGWASGGLGTLTGNSAAVLTMDNCYIYRMLGGSGVFDTFDVVDLGLTFGNSAAANLLELSGTIRQKSLRIMQQSSATGAVSDVSSGVNRYARYEWQDSGTFTPTMTVAGTEITTDGGAYSLASGEWTMNGDLMFFRASVVLSAKPSTLTGEIRISGLPKPSAATGNTAYAARAFNLSSGLTIVPYMFPGGTSLVLQKVGASGATNLAVSDITNTTSINISGVYKWR